MDNLYSKEWEVYIEELSPSIKECIDQIKSFFSIDVITVLKYDAYSIVIPVTYTIPIPPNGTVNDIDIRPEEPMLVQISIKNYPYEIPKLLSDRRDFPKQNLPHLYASRNNNPASLCLVRNSPNEWFANKTILDLLDVARQWLYKAAIGKLVEDGNEFDPIRLECYCGYHIYKYNILNEIVSQKVRFLPEFPFTLLFSYIYKNDYQNKKGLIHRSLSPVPFIQKNDFLKIIPKISQESNDISPLFSILIWNEDDVVEEEYSTILPTTYSDLKRYFERRKIDIEKIIISYKQANCMIKNGIPIIYAMKRPKKMVGYDGQYEFINFLVSASGSKNVIIPENATVLIQRHIEPFSKELASKVSGDQRNVKSLFIGAGSLGSKIIIHDARSGKLDIGVIDNDNLLQHNLVRHALFNSKIGLNKSEAIVKEIGDLFEFDNRNGFKSFPIKIKDLTIETVSNYDWVVDTTASVDVLNWLTNEVLPSHIIVARGELADEGQLGLLYIEGKNRNPRVDDLVNLAYYEAMNYPVLMEWRKRDAKREINSLSVGLGCSSTTTVMPDDTISFHASIFSKVLYNQSHRKTIADDGLLYLSINNNDGLPSINSEYKLVIPFDIYPCLRGSNWELRMMSGINKRLLSLCNEKHNIETGGVLVGMVNYKTKVIHVFDIIVEPSGSSGTCNGFTRGNRRLPDEIDIIKKKTGNVIGYVGEWHTHPMNLESLSSRDSETIAKLIPINNQTPIPTCAVIVTKEKILPYIFE